MPLIIRVDGRAFHTLTRNSDKPFDEKIQYGMRCVAYGLFNEVQGSKFVYQQSDEVSLLVTNYDKLETESWFGNNLQKIVSLSASIATESFYSGAEKLAHFDARAFIIPKEEVCNYFVWRQNDCVKNAISGYAQVFFSPKQLDGKNQDERLRMIESIGESWNAVHPMYKYGYGYHQYDGNRTHETRLPLFRHDRNFIERFIFLGGE